MTTFDLPDNTPNLEGMVFARLTAVSYCGRKYGKHRWICRCSCGELTEVSGPELRAGRVQSCGCLRRERCTKHGLFKTEDGASANPAYKPWMSMIARCCLPKTTDYDRYGGRGVNVCDRWMKFESFLEDMGERPSLGHTIDRIDGSKGYDPSNCRWATVTEQNQNRSNTVWIDYQGQRKTLAEWCRVFGVRFSLVRKRVAAGWDFHRAITEPSMRPHPVGTSKNPK